MLLSASRALTVLLVFLLSGCALTPQRAAEIDQLVDGLQGQLDLPPNTPWQALPELDALYQPDNGHHVLIVDRGDQALALRVALIRSAHERILIKNYIFQNDAAGTLLLTELIHAARRGVRVHVLVDSLFSLPDPDTHAALALADANFALRIYNPIFNQAVLSNGGFLAAIACCFRSLNHRMHNKLVAVDGRHGLIGGRNTADRYFDMDTRMNFVDLELLVSGPAVAEMERGFDLYWTHELARAPRHTRDVAARLAERPPSSFGPASPARTAFVEDMLASPVWLSDLIADHGYRVADLVYFTDPPNKPFGADATPDRSSTALLHALMAGAREEILIQTPYFVMSPHFEAVLAARGEGVEVTVSSNSLAATDAYPVYAMSRRQRARMVGSLGLNYFEAKPYPANRHRLIARYPELIADRAAGIASPMRGDPAPAVRDMPGPRISLHAKILVVDAETAVVTSHNFDPRSEIFNTENGVIVRDPAFAGALADIVRLMTEPGNAWLVAKRPDEDFVFAEFSRAMARASRRLPTLDIWPVYLTQNYQLPSGVDWVPVDHPDFYQHWVAVGHSPEVVRGQRHFMTGLISRMFGFLWPIM